MKSLVKIGSLAAALVALGSASEAHAYVREQSNWNPNALPITYYINQATIPSTLGTDAGIAALDGGFASWSAPSCTTWRTTDAGNTTTSANTNDRRNVQLWISGSWPAELGSVNSVIGVTTPVWSSGGYFIDADIRYNNVGFRWTTTGSGGSVDAQSIATHEEGHFLGLDHSASATAVMYASYSGGLKRTLTSDDQNGVCAIYPSGVAPTDAGTSTGDRCNAFGNTCADCTPNNGCGFCADTNQCVTGNSAGPTTGSCGTYVWLPRDCAAAGTDAGTGGTGRFGDPCTSPNDCGSGGLCIGISATEGLCSRACNDDCGCPSGYACYMTNDPSLSVCAPGTGTCATAPDAGTIQPGDDAAVVPGNDAAVVADDGAVIPGMDDASTSAPHGTTAGGCSCSAAGGGQGGLGAAGLALALGVTTAIRRRRRAR
ncbi:MAG: matrixin family metalloprotease [Sandaracinus sp.]